ncbi:hypothetical protein P0C22_13475 [Plesiomonas shigelloides]|uniref:hypothetical protein n=1 Tax=Plesiomonas shigelloides TaxID=703 RepID=UPI0030C21CD8
MSKILYALVFIPFFVFSAEPNTSVTLRCFISDESNIKMRMLWVSSEGWSGGYVQYGAEKTKISVVQVKRTEEYLVEGRPPVVDVQLLEVVNGVLSGEYLLQYQGAIMDISYKNKKGRKFTFRQAEHSYDECFITKNRNY